MRKRHIRDLARQLMPTSARALSRQLSRADLEVLRTWARPVRAKAGPVSSEPDWFRTAEHRHPPAGLNHTLPLAYDAPRRR